jgi:hypothetical protein
VAYGAFDGHADILARTVCCIRHLLIMDLLELVHGVQPECRTTPVQKPRHAMVRRSRAPTSALIETPTSIETPGYGTHGLGSV